MKDFIAGCNILMKYSDNIDICAEHDIIYTYLNRGDEEVLSLEDCDALDALSGWHWNEDNDCWAYFT